LLLYWQKEDSVPNESRDNPELSRLHEAFEAFNAVSGQLETSYAGLQSEVRRLEGELARANARHSREAERNAELAARLAALLEALPAGVIVLDGAGQVRELNTTATDYLGAPLRDVPWNAVRSRAFAEQQDDAGDLKLRDGRTLNLAQGLLGPGRVLLFTDVTEHRKVQQLLSRHRRLAAMGEMAAALAHQLRTPLSAALLYASNAARADLPEERRQSQLEKATRCLHDLEQLIGDMLQFARGASAAEDRVSVAGLLDSVRTALTPVLSQHQQLHIGPVDDRLCFAGNREAVAGALLNLANNALQHAGPGARVEISAQRNGTDIEFRVRDNGPGVPAESRERIFEPFFTSRPDGTGLGLAVARSVARAHSGDIRLDTKLHTGCCFVLHLPASRPSAPVRQPGDTTQDAAA
jgi:two-component system sensor histidine kinase FlrB